MEDQHTADGYCQGAYLGAGPGPRTLARPGSISEAVDPLASAARRPARLFRVSKCPRATTSIRFSRDGKLMLTGDEDGALYRFLRGAHERMRAPGLM